jgi:hypothetical protein
LFALLIAAAVIVRQQCLGRHAADEKPIGLKERGVGMANIADIRDAYGVPAMFVGSKTGRDDAAFVFIRVGDEERRMRWAEWDALPAWSGPRPSWAPKR